MAQTVVIAGSHNSAKIRNPWGVLGLTLITFGVYHLFWWHYANRELKDYGIVKQRDLGDSPTRSLLAIWKLSQADCTIEPGQTALLTTVLEGVSLPDEDGEAIRLYVGYPTRDGTPEVCVFDSAAQLR